MIILITITFKKLIDSVFWNTLKNFNNCQQTRPREDKPCHIMRTSWTWKWFYYCMKCFTWILFTKPPKRENSTWWWSLIKFDCTTNFRLEEAKESKQIGDGYLKILCNVLNEVFCWSTKINFVWFSWLLGYKWLRPTCKDHTFTNSHAFFDSCRIPALSSQIYSIFVY